MPEEKKPTTAAAPAETKPAETTPPPPAPTPEEMEAQSEEFIAANGWGNPPPKPKATEPAAKPADEPAAETPAADPALEEAKPEKKKKYVPGKKGATPEEVEAIARRVVEERESEPAQEPAPEPAAPSEDEIANLSDDNREMLDVFGELESSNPEKYKDLRKKALRFWKAEDELVAKWTAAHPDEAFNRDAPENREFYRKNEPRFESKDYRQADRGRIARDAADQAEKRLRKEFEPKLREIEADKAERAAQPKIVESVGDAVESVFKSVPEFEKLVEPGNLSEEAVAKMAEINPVVHHHVSEEAEVIMSVVGELEKLTHLSRHYKLDATAPQKLSSGRVIHPHALIDAAYRELEATISSAPKADRMDEGREFITGVEMARRMEAIRQKYPKPADRERAVENLKSTTWNIAPEHIRTHLIKQSKARVAAISKKFGHFTKQPEPTTATNGQQIAPPPPVPKPTAKAGLQKGTATTAVSDTVDNSESTRIAAQKEDEDFVRAAFS